MSELPVDDRAASGGGRARVAVVASMCDAAGPPGSSLAAVGAQTLRPDVVRIVVPVDSVEGVRRAASRFEVVTCAGRGRAGALNAGIAAGDEEFIATITDGARPEPGWLEALVARARSHPQEDAWASVVVSDDAPATVLAAGCTVDTDGAPVFLWRGEPVWSLPAEPVEVLGPLATAALYRRRALEGLGLFDERLLRPARDLDAALRMRLAGGRCVLVPDARVRTTRAPVEGAPRSAAVRDRLCVLAAYMPLWWLLLRSPGLAFSGTHRMFAKPWSGRAWEPLAARIGLLASMPRAIARRARARLGKKVADADLVRMLAPARAGPLGRTTRWLTPVMASTVESEEYELAMARQRMRDRRTARATVLVRDAAGRPVAGADVSVELERREFLLGCGVDMCLPAGEASDDAPCGARFLDLFDLARIDVGRRARGPAGARTRLDEVDGILAQCRRHRIAACAWGLLHPGFDALQPGADASELERLGRIADVARHHGPAIGTWEVTPAPGGLRDALRRCAQLRDAGTFAPGTVAVAVHGALGYLDALDDARRALEGSRAVDAIAVSARHPAGARFPLDHVRWTLDRLAESGLPLDVIDIAPPAGGRPIACSHRVGMWDEESQAEYAERFVRVCASHPAVRSISWREFGPWTGDSGVVRADGTPRPVHAALARLATTEWAPRVDARTDADGRCELSGVRGTYRIRVTRDGIGFVRTIRLTGDAPGRIVVCPPGASDAAHAGAGERGDPSREGHA